MIRAIEKWMLTALTAAGATALLGCATPNDSGVVEGRLMVADLASPTDSFLYTKRAGAGVQITSSVGGGRNPAAISGPEAVRLVNSMEQRLRDWPRYVAASPFEETIMIGLVGTTAPEPLTVALAKTSTMVEPVFIITLAATDSVVAVALDRSNAQRWIADLRRALTY